MVLFMAIQNERRNQHAPRVASKKTLFLVAWPLELSGHIFGEFFLLARPLPPAPPLSGGFPQACVKSNKTKKPRYIHYYRADLQQGSRPPPKKIIVIIGGEGHSFFTSRGGGKKPTTFIPLCLTFFSNYTRVYMLFFTFARGLLSYHLIWSLCIQNT